MPEEEIHPSFYDAAYHILEAGDAETIARLLDTVSRQSKVISFLAEEAIDYKEQAKEASEIGREEARALMWEEIVSLN